MNTMMSATLSTGSAVDNLQNIFARNCSVRRIDKPTATAFIERYHRLGQTTCRYRYGLFVERSTGEDELRLPQGTLVAVAEFSNARRWTKGDRKISSYEWIRYASLEGVRIVGGMGKMLNAFVKEVHPDDVMSYADLSWPDGGNAYRMLGFEDEGLVERPGFTCRKFRLRLTDQTVTSRVE